MGAYLLAYVARNGNVRNFVDWIHRARDLSSWYSGALAFESVALELVSNGLAEFGDALRIDGRIASFSLRCDRTSLLAIAKELLVADPPRWLATSVSTREVNRAYIPSADLEEISWMDPHLDWVLIAARRQTRLAGDRELLPLLGRAAEEIMVRALERAGRMPLHVSAISDVYGYDIECRMPVAQFIEVKSCSPRSKGTFHLTRNEYDQALVLGDQWSLIQVEFSSKAFLTSTFCEEMVSSVREVPSSTILQLAPPDSETFTWEESARFHVETHAWRDVSADVLGFTKAHSKG